MKHLKTFESFSASKSFHRVEKIEEGLIDIILDAWDSFKKSIKGKSLEEIKKGFMDEVLKINKDTTKAEQEALFDKASKNRFDGTLFKSGGKVMYNNFISTGFNG